MLTVLNIKRVIFDYFSTWQAGSVRNSFPNRRLHVGLPKPFFTLRVSCAFLQNAYLPYGMIPENEKTRSQALAKTDVWLRILNAVFPAAGAPEKLSVLPHKRTLYSFLQSGAPERLP